MNIKDDINNDCTNFIILNKVKYESRTSCCHFDHCIFESNPKQCPKYEVKENKDLERHYHDKNTK